VQTAIAVGEAVAGVLPTHRQCTIEIKNESSQYSLSEPSYHIISGKCTEPLVAHLDPSSTGTALFIKTPHSARGAVGVFTYNLCNEQTKQTTGKMAVMFSVPYDYSLYSNWYAVGIFDNSTECNRNLYDQMYNGSTDGPFVRGKASGPSLKYQKDQVSIMATMSDASTSMIKVQVKDNWNDGIQMC
ncbi:hemolytic toxin Avt-1-like, partial [Stegastes partitus]|uniref:Hemolytic toxin Avt-1-like n=1 Tax=Stegastes partitus TaxID=144197 RepID=A0A9Y4N9V4_9TELE